MHGVEQFIETYNRVKDRHNDVLKWGDEVRVGGCGARVCGDREVQRCERARWSDPLLPQIEYHLVELPPQSADGAPSVHGPRLALIAPEVIERLEKEDEHLNLCVR